MCYIAAMNPAVKATVAAVALLAACCAQPGIPKARARRGCCKPVPEVKADRQCVAGRASMPWPTGISWDEIDAFVYYPTGSAGLPGSAQYIEAPIIVDDITGMFWADCVDYPPDEAIPTHVRFIWRDYDNVNP